MQSDVRSVRPDQRDRKPVAVRVTSAGKDISTPWLACTAVCSWVSPDGNPGADKTIPGTGPPRRAGYWWSIPKVEIDARLGVGVATPDHILSITPVWACPASEPEGVPFGSPPYPGQCPGSGAGTFIYVADTGLLKGADAAHPWLAGVTGTVDPLHEQAGVTTIPDYAGHGTFIAGVARCMAPAPKVEVASTCAPLSASSGSALPCPQGSRTASSEHNVGVMSASPTVASTRKTRSRGAGPSCGLVSAR